MLRMLLQLEKSKKSNTDDTADDNHGEMFNIYDNGQQTKIVSEILWLTIQMLVVK